jgi:hypothetical protein
MEPTVYNRVDKSSQQDPVHNQVNPVHILTL